MTRHREPSLEQVLSKGGGLEGDHPAVFTASCFREKLCTGSNEWKIMDEGGNQLEEEEGVSPKGRRDHESPCFSSLPSLC